ncbi:MAG: lecithin retinol acyltransferase family protein [Solirubrobacteraceae bacterium]|jgi:hypothetical protein
MARGDVLFVSRRGLIYHYGIDVGDGTVMHLRKSVGVVWTTAEEFAHRDEIRINRNCVRRFHPDEVVARAASMVGSHDYDVFTNNCEHFANWCVSGERSSLQVDAAVSTTAIGGVSSVAPLLGAKTVVQLGVGPSPSAPNLMSGLAELGGTAVMGIFLLAAIGGGAGAATFSWTMRDKPSLPEEERHARAGARRASAGGAAAGVGLTLAIVGAAGVPGYGATGISSGLAALGRPLGGGMANGIRVSCLLPLLAAIILGMCWYQYEKSRRVAPRPVLRPGSA